MIVDSPGVGDSKRVSEITLKYLSQAHAFIYVINTPNAGGLQQDWVNSRLVLCLIHFLEVRMYLVLHKVYVTYKDAVPDYNCF